MLHQVSEEEKENLDDVTTSTIQVPSSNSYLELLRNKTLNQKELKQVNSET
jgi:hypothetical protein